MPTRNFLRDVGEDIPKISTSIQFSVLYLELIRARLGASLDPFSHEISITPLEFKSYGRDNVLRDELPKVLGNFKLKRIGGPPDRSVIFPGRILSFKKIGLRLPWWILGWHYPYLWSHYWIATLSESMLILLELPLPSELFSKKEIMILHFKKDSREEVLKPLKSLFMRELVSLYVLREDIKKA